MVCRTEEELEGKKQAATEALQWHLEEEICDLRRDYDALYEAQIKPRVVA
jgi:hypothetical protein